MNANAKKWVAALRSGEFRQTRGRLLAVTPHGEEHCCLGVACELYLREHDDLHKDVEMTRYWSTSRDGRTAVQLHSGTLPNRVKDWLGLKDDGALFWDDGYETSLIELNDNERRDFGEIAEVIESEPKGLFVRSREISPGKLDQLTEELRTIDG